MAVPGIPDIVLELGLIIMNKMNEVGSGIYFQSSLIFHRYFKKPFIVEQLSLGIKARNPNGYLLGLIFVILVILVYCESE